MSRSILFVFLILSLNVNAEIKTESLVPYAGETTAKEISPVIIRESPYSYKKTVENLLKAIKGKNYKIIRQQKIDYGFVKKEDESSDLIIYFCNFKLLHTALKVDSRIGQFLPCRITVYEREGKTFLVVINPKIIGRLIHNNDLDNICDKVTKMYVDILDEVTI